MNSHRAARWSGSGICNGRLRLVIPNARYYSLHASRPSLRPANDARCLRNTLRTFNFQQTRSISLFGWGSSSSPSNPNEFASAHAPAGTPPDKVFTNTATPSPASIEQTRSVKAFQATSDVPDPSTSISTELPNTPEPAFLKNLENAIADPSGHAPEVSKAVSQISEYKGYLKEVCGLDYGWGPTALMENVLETLHMTAGFSWTASIVGIAVFYRAVCAIFVYRGADQGVKMKEMMPVLQPIREEVAKATLAGDLAKRQQLSAEMQAINKEMGFSPLKLFLPLLVQIPLGFGGFRLLRGCATAPVPGFLEESWLWNVDLTITDPYYAVPALQGALLYLAVRMSQKAGIQVLEGGMGTLLMVVLPAVSVVWSTFQPGSVQLFFLTSTALATMQSWLLSKNRFRRAIGLLAMPDSKPIGPRNPTNPGGLRRFPGSGKVIDVKPSPAATSDSSRNVSFIDKMVDTAKAKSNQLKNGGIWGATLAEKEAKQKKWKEEADFKKAAKYEYTRKQQLEYERESKTRMQQSQQAATRSRTVKKEKSRR